MPKFSHESIRCEWRRWFNARDLTRENREENVARLVWRETPAVCTLNLAGDIIFQAIKHQPGRNANRAAGRSATGANRRIRIKSKATRNRTVLARKLLRAQKMHRAGKLEEARTLYQQLIRSAPDYSDAHNFLGILHFQNGDVKSAIESIRHAISLQPGEAGPYNNLGNILRTTGDLEGAIEVYGQASRLAPDDRDIRENHEKALAAMKRTERALEDFRQAVALNPDAAEVYKNAVRAMYAEGRSDETVEIFRRWLEHDPDNPTARHMLAATLGETTLDRASEEYVRETFDGFADTFDAVLERLGYKVPELAVASLKKHWDSRKEIGSVLDAGCGTGLCGPLLRPLTAQLIGVDLSAKMLLKASARNVYDRLSQADLVEFLQQESESFDVILSADTLIYFGDMAPVLKAGFSALRPGGLCIFSIEGNDPDNQADYSITPSGRYAHSESYILGLAGSLGFSIEASDAMVARTERGKPVAGRLVVLKKPD